MNLTTTKNKIKIILFLIVTISSSFAITTKAKGLVLNTTAQSPLNKKDKTGFLDEVTNEAFSRVGLELITIQLPAERGLINVNTGIDDGEMSRIAGLQKRYSNIIPVPEKIMDMDFVVFSKKKIVLDKGWESLKPYSIAIINGWKILENKVPKSAGLTKVNYPRQLFDMLEKGRAELVIYERFSGQEIIKSSQYKDIKLIEPPLATKEMFMYLNKKHQSLVPKLSQALREMKDDGTYQNIIHQTLR